MVRRPFSAASELRGLPAVAPLVCTAIGTTSFHGFSIHSQWTDIAEALQDDFEGLGLSTGTALDGLAAPRQGRLALRHDATRGRRLSFNQMGRVVYVVALAAPRVHVRAMALSGHCSGSLAEMSVDVVTAAVIARPRAEVAAFAADPDNATKWYENIKSTRWETGPPLEVGSRIAFVATFLGRRLTYTYEIREYVAGERLVMSTSQGPFPMETRYTWADEGQGGTRMTLRNRGEPAGFARVAAPLMARAMRRANENDLAKLKGLLESGH